MDTTGEASDRDVFRVQPLRNVARTAPYFHSGSIAELDEAVAVMARVRLGRTPTAEVTADMVRFLESLSGSVPAHYQPADAP